ncbi:MAG: hypothetical protein PVJ11_11450, partial [Syntrophobacterales bacterium]
LRQYLLQPHRPRSGYRWFFGNPRADRRLVGLLEPREQKARPPVFDLSLRRPPHGRGPQREATGDDWLRRNRSGNRDY